MAARAVGPALFGAMVVAVAGAPAWAQDVSVVRLPQSTDMTVRLENLVSHLRYEASGNSYFIVPTGRYSIQLLRGGQVIYQDAEFIGPEAPSTRTLNPERMEIAVGLAEENPQFEPTVCSALETAARLAVSRFGVRGRDVERRVGDGDLGGGRAGEDARCGTSNGVEAAARTVAGSYGVTPVGMVGLSVEFTPLAPQRRPRNRGNSPIYTDPATQRLSPVEQPASNLTPSLVGDLKNGISDVVVDDAGKSLLVCAALDANTPVFCDSNGLAVATPAIAHLRGLYRFSVKTTPVDSHGVEEDHWLTFAGEDEYRATQQKLESDVEGMRVSLERRIARVEATSVIAPSAHDAAQSTRYYATQDLALLIETTRSEMNEALQGATLQPLQLHFSKRTPRINPLHPATPEMEAQRVFRELRDMVGVLAKVSEDLGVDLVFRTAPVETEDSRLTFEACDRCFTVASQGGVHRFYRGRYYIKTSRDGYSVYEGWLDLVDDPRTILDCDLVRTRRAANGHGSTCSLKAQ